MGKGLREKSTRMEMHEEKDGGSEVREGTIAVADINFEPTHSLTAGATATATRGVVPALQPTKLYPLAGGL